MVPVHKIETFRGAWDLFGPLNGTSDSEGHFGAKKVLYENPHHRATTALNINILFSSYFNPAVRE